jgi:hypothetical protein
MIRSRYPAASRVVPFCPSMFRRLLRHTCNMTEDETVQRVTIPGHSGMAPSRPCREEVAESPPPHLHVRADGGQRRLFLCRHGGPAGSAAEAGQWNSGVPLHDTATRQGHGLAAALPTDRENDRARRFFCIILTPSGSLGVGEDCTVPPELCVAARRSTLLRRHPPGAWSG